MSFRIPILPDRQHRLAGVRNSSQPSYGAGHPRQDHGTSTRCQRELYSDTKQRERRGIAARIQDQPVSSVFRD